MIKRHIHKTQENCRGSHLTRTLLSSKLHYVIIINMSINMIPHIGTQVGTQVRRHVSYKIKQCERQQYRHDISRVHTNVNVISFFFIFSLIHFYILLLQYFDYISYQFLQYTGTIFN